MQGILNTIAGVFLVILGILAVFFLWGMMSVWFQGKMGEATHRKASFARKVIVEQALAEKEAAQLRAEAIEIVGQKAKEYPEYRYQEFLGNLGEAIVQGHVEQIIYIPTEANLPIMEAGRLIEYNDAQ